MFLIIIHLHTFDYYTLNLSKKKKHTQNLLYRYFSFVLFLYFTLLNHFESTNAKTRETLELDNSYLKTEPRFGFCLTQSNINTLVCSLLSVTIYTVDAWILCIMCLFFLICSI